MIRITYDLIKPPCAAPSPERYQQYLPGNARDAMNAYLEWEYGLVAQLGKDGTHGFFVI